jgi:hypothetical protein
MPNLSLEERVAALEVEVRQLKHKRAYTPKEEQPWWDRIFGAFANDPMFDEAMRLGEEYRRSQRPDYDDGSDNPHVPS